MFFGDFLFVFLYLADLSEYLIMISKPPVAKIRAANVKVLGPSAKQSKAMCLEQTRKTWCRGVAFLAIFVCLRIACLGKSLAPDNDVGVE